MASVRLFTILFLVLGVACAALVALKFQELEDAVQPQLVSVLRARLDVPEGTSLADAMAEDPPRVVRVDDAPALLATAVPDLITPDVVPHLFNNAKLHVALRAGEFVTRRHLEPMSDDRVAAFLREQNPEGHQLILATYRITEENSVDTRVQPGHRVQVRLAPRSGEPRTVAESVLVFAAGSKIYTDAGGTDMRRRQPYRSITFAASQHIHDILESAQQEGELRIRLPLEPASTVAKGE